MQNAPRVCTPSHGFQSVPPVSSQRLPLSLFHQSLVTNHQSLSPVESAVPRFPVLTPLECAVTKTRLRNPFRMRSYEKRWGGGSVLPLHPFSSLVAALSSAHSVNSALRKTFSHIPASPLTEQCPVARLRSFTSCTSSTSFTSFLATRHSPLSLLKSFSCPKTTSKLPSRSLRKPEKSS